MDYFLQALRKYTVFSGRARRKEFWMFALFQFLLSIATAILDNLFGTTILDGSSGYLSLLGTFALAVPSFAVSVRRLHDVNKSGWFLLIAIIPLVGIIWLFILECTEGTRGENNYGSDPKAEEVLVY
jgi:uncharacterized membrane protein YhaH (DUF805 family)